MLKDKKAIKLLNLNNKNLINNYFSISHSQETKFKKLIEELVTYNKHTNLVGKSTLIDPWRSHILDSIQITSFMEKKNGMILKKNT